MPLCLSVYHVSTLVCCQCNYVTQYRYIYLLTVYCLSLYVSLAPFLSLYKPSQIILHCREDSIIILEVQTETRRARYKWRSRQDLSRRAGEAENGNKAVGVARGVLG